MSSVSQSQKTVSEEQVKLYTFEHLLEEQGYLVYTATGCSMMPFLRQRKDIVEIFPLTTLPKKYEVYLYKRGNRYVLHRCVSTSPIIFAGDHNTFKEYDVTNEMILGVMNRAIRDGKSIYPNNYCYRLYYHLWVDFFPVRVYILKSKRYFRAGLRKFKKLLKYNTYD